MWQFAEKTYINNDLKNDDNETEIYLMVLCLASDGHVDGV
ncbi:hypothetical protein HMPREF1218_1155 [Hoylesella pleuritidis F0068]|jgi:hypothetical protein|uniref:Uncharacterized protein n=1 Tax=Hoylesella pleuritidis F0068 TaxID=1081904 RepID=U2L423_9BACT|nr:hypothetical protein HMPREF1218_1155 [Hoylesella pleuritidis F0068]